MNRKFILNLILLVALNLLVKPFWVFGIDRTVQNVVGADSYGFYFALFNFSLICNMLLDLGITNYNNRHISQNEHELVASFERILTLRLALGVLYVAVTIGAALLCNYTKQQIGMLWLLSLNQFLLSLILYLRSNLAGLQLFKTDSIISVLDRFLLIAICSVLLWGNVTKSAFRIEWFVWAQTATYLLTAAVALCLVLWHSGPVKLNFDWRQWMQVLKQSYPFAILALLMSTYNRIDSVMIERLLPDGACQTGVYAQAFRIYDAACMFGFLFSQLLLPMFSKMIKQRQSVADLVRLSTILMIVPVVALTSACLTYRNQLMNLLYNSHIQESAAIFAPLMVGFVGVALTYIYGTLLTANGSLHRLNIVALCGVLFNVAANLVVIPRFGAFGAAVVSMLTQTLTCIAQIIIAFYTFGFAINKTKPFAFLAYVAVIVMFAVVVPMVVEEWIVGFASIILIGGVLALLLRLVKLKAIFELLHNKKIV